MMILFFLLKTLMRYIIMSRFSTQKNMNRTLGYLILKISNYHMHFF